jgi:hypothetical protein
MEERKYMRWGEEIKCGLQKGGTVPIALQFCCKQVILYHNFSALVGWLGQYSMTHHLLVPYLKRDLMARQLC